MAANSNGIVMIKWVLGIIITGMTLMATGVIANDRRNTDQHRQIRTEMITRDEKIMDTLHRVDIRQEVLIKSVGRIEDKL